MTQSRTTAVRPPAVAGYFYPADRATLVGDLDRYLAAAKPEIAGHAGVPKAIIAPHAGYVYSGPVAASAYARLAPARGRITRVVLVGPAHRLAFRGLALPASDAFATPLGQVPIDGPACAAVAGLDGVQVLDAAHAEEHSLEVHLPFLQRVLDGFSLVPLVVGDAEPAVVAAVLEALWGGPETLVVVSSDLSHYLDHATATRVDRATARRIEVLDHDELGPDDACGCRPIAGLLRLAGKLDLRATTLDLRNSGDIAGGRDRVVGYGAWMFESNRTARLGEADRAQLIAIAARAIRQGLETGAPAEVPLAGLPPALTALRASFVTLTAAGRLRGCVGSSAPYRPLCRDVAANAHGAAFADGRFQALGPGELAGLEIGVSVLGTAHELAFGSEPELLALVRPGIDGLTLVVGERRATLLPAVWRRNSEPTEFLAVLKQKAGLKPGDWPADIRAWRYTAESFAGPY